MIFVTGCPRSGTSLTAKILHAHGCNLGQPINSLYENVSVRQLVLKPYLVSVGADPLGQRVLPDTDNLPSALNLKGRVLRYIVGDEPRAYKDAKLTLVWPVFDEAFPDAKWVLVRRSKHQIVDSCMRTPFMRAWSRRGRWESWVEEHERRFEKMKELLNVLEVWPDCIIEEPQAFVSVAEFCELQFNFEATERAIDRKSWHNG